MPDILTTSLSLWKAEGGGCLRLPDAPHSQPLAPLELILHRGFLLLRKISPVRQNAGADDNTGGEQNDD